MSDQSWYLAEQDLSAPTIGMQTRMTTATNRFSIGVADTAEKALALEAEWRALETLCSEPIFFQSFDWCRLAIEHADQDTQILIYTAHDNGRLVALLPLKIQKKSFRKILTGVAEPFQQYTDILVAPDLDPKTLINPILAAIKKSGADYIHLGQVRHTSALHHAIDGVIPVTGEEKGAPCVPLSQWTDFDSYFQTIKSKTRKNMRNARNRLERDGEITHEVAFDGPLLEQVIDRTFEGRAEWLERMGLTSRAFQNSDFENFLNTFKSPTTSGVRTIALSLKYKGAPIAEQWGFIFNKRYYAFISTWDTSFKESSPGRMHLGEVIKASFAEELDCADFMIPAVPYKLTWAPEVIAVNDHILPLTPIGWLYGNLWVKFLRPLAKKAAYAIPTDLRKSIINTIFSRKTGSDS